MKKIKGILCFALIFALLTGTLYVGAAAVDSSAVCLEYYDIIKESIKHNGGVCEPSKVEVYDSMPFPDEPGLYYAGIIDMDGDSVPELVLMESVAQPQDEYDKILGTYDYDLYLRIYTARNGKATRILNEDLGFVWRWGYYKAADGNTYVCIDNVDIVEFYGAKNGKLAAKSFRSVVTNGGFGCYVNGEYVWVSIPGYNSSASYYINDKSVTVSEYVAQKDAMRKTELQLFGTESNYPSDKTAYNTLNELEALLPPSYVSGYTTPSSWAKDAVDKAKELGILPAHLQRMYNQPITRLHFCELAMEFYEHATASKITERMDFTDTKSEAVRKMGGLGIINGTGGGKFSPDDYLTREQAAVILARMAEKLGWTLPEADTDFADKASIAPWAQEAVGSIQASGIMNGTGDNKFSPKAQYTREQSILTMLRMQDVQAPVTDVEISYTGLVPIPGGHRTLTAVALRDGEKVPQTFVWSSSNPDVVSVDANTGVITCHKPGRAVITATSGSGVKGEYKITVPTAQDNIYLDASDIMVGESRDVFRGVTGLKTGLCYFRPLGVSYEQKDGWPFDYIMLQVQAPKLPELEYNYLDWKLYDANGKLVDSGDSEKQIHHYNSGDGDSFTFTLRTDKLNPNKYYLLEIIDFEP